MARCVLWHEPNHNQNVCYRPHLLEIGARHRQDGDVIEEARQRARDARAKVHGLMAPYLRRWQAHHIAMLEREKKHAIAYRVRSNNEMKARREKQKEADYNFEASTTITTHCHAFSCAFHCRHEKASLSSSLSS